MEHPLKTDAQPESQDPDPKAQDSNPTNVPFKWTPNFDRAPPPLWRPGAPCSFERARAWLRRRQLAEELGNDPVAPPDDRDGGQVRVRKPAADAPAPRRLRGKQAAPAARSSGAVAVEFPLPKARVAARPARLDPDELTPHEQGMLEGYGGVMRNRLLKLILHNRTAVERGKHFVSLGHVEDSLGQIRCRDCSMEGRWSAWHSFTVTAVCKRGQSSGSASASRPTQ